MKKVIAIFLLIWQDLIDLFHQFKPVSNSSNNIAADLRSNGIVFQENFLSETECSFIKAHLEKIAEKNKQSITTTNGTRLNYRNAQNPQAYDHGMLDILLGEEDIVTLNVEQKFKVIGRIISEATNQKTFQTRVNAYINKSVANTRDYHLDNIQPNLYKAFVYLTDVPDKSYGPYSFVKSSHKASIWPYLNSVLNVFSGKKETDMCYYPKRNVIHALGKKGTLVISSQNGMHRGLPQEEGRERYVLLFGFIAISRWNYLGSNVRKEISEAREVWNP